MAPGKKLSFMTNNRGQYRYILVIKDCFSKFCWLKPTKTKSASEVHTILHNFFCYHEGPPKCLQTDNGKEFINEVVKNPYQSLEVKIIHGRPYQPESQGQVENLNKRVKKNSRTYFAKDRRMDKPNYGPIFYRLLPTSMQTRYVIVGHPLLCREIVVMLYIFKRNTQFDKFAYCRNENCQGPQPAKTEHEDIVELETNAERFEPLKLPPESAKSDSLRLIKSKRKRKEVKKCETVQD